MDLALHRREKEGIQILDLSGRLAAGNSAVVLETALNESGNECGQTGIGIVLNLADVTEINEEGLGVLAAWCSSLASSGGSLKLLNIHLSDPSLIVLTRLHTMYEVFTDEQDAVNSFFPGRVVGNFDILELVRSHNGVSQPIFTAA